MVRVHTRKKTDLVSVMVRVNTRKKSDCLLSYIILYCPTFLILAGSDALGCVTGTLYISNISRKRIKRTSASTHKSLLKKTIKSAHPQEVHRSLMVIEVYLRAFCWMNLPDYVIFDYNLPAKCHREDLDVILKMTQCLWSR